MRCILFVPQNAQHRTVQQPVFDELSRRSSQLDVTPTWGLPKARGDIPALYSGHWPWEGDLAVYSCGPCDQRFLGRSVYMPHGVGDEVAEGFTGLGALIPGALWEPAYRAEGCADERRFCVVGYPRVDILSAPDDVRRRVTDEWRERLDLPFDRTVLFSGFYYYGYERHALTESIHQLLTLRRKEDFNVVFKPHINTYLSSFDDWFIPVPQSGAFDHDDFGLRGLGMPYDHFAHKHHDLRGLNWLSPFMGRMVELYLVSDVCVGGEGSSILFEFAVTRKPTIGVVECAGKVPRLHSGRNCAATELPAALAEAFSEPGKHRDACDAECAARIHMPDGHAAARCADALVEMLEALHC